MAEPIKNPAMTSDQWLRYSATRFKPVRNAKHTSPRDSTGLARRVPFIGSVHVKYIYEREDRDAKCSAVEASWSPFQNKTSTVTLTNAVQLSDPIRLAFIEERLHQSVKFLFLSFGIKAADLMVIRICICIRGCGWGRAWYEHVDQAGAPFHSSHVVSFRQQRDPNIGAMSPESNSTQEVSLLWEVSSNAKIAAEVLTTTL